MNLPPPPQHDDPIIMQFKPAYGQWELTDDSIKRVDPETGHTILHNYHRYINTTPLEVYRYLIETKGCDVNAQDKYNDTPLHNVFEEFDPDQGGDITVLMHLLTQEDVNVNIKGLRGNNLLHYACQHINRLPFDIFKVLIETKGCDVNALGDNKNTPLHYAIHYFNTSCGGNITVLMYLLSQKGVNVNTKGKYGRTLLHYACNKINSLPIGIFQYLIETLGFDVNTPNIFKDTPLLRALCSFNPNGPGDINVLTYLIDHMNVNLNIKGHCDRTLLHYACIKHLSGSWDSIEINAKTDTHSCQMVELIVERCIRQVLDETTP